MMAARGARVILVVDPPAVSLLSGMPGVVACLSKSGAVLPDFDMHCPMSSLPLAFGTRLDTIPAETAYLPPPAASRVHAWEQRLRAHEKSRERLRVGLVWSGNPLHQNDHNRSIRLSLLSRILDVDATFVSLQKDPRREDQVTLRDHPEIIDLTVELADFSETAALISCLDLVITVDTSVAHLAAALGRPTWILLPFTPDYRWLLDRDDSPWYPTARLFRQSAKRDYGEVLDRVRDALRALIAERQDSLTSPAALYEAGLDHRRAGRHRDARLCCEQALSADPGHADALHLMGLLSFDAGQHDQAVDWIACAIRQDPRPEFLSSLGITLQAQGRHEEALNVFDKAVQLKPEDAGLWKQLGGALVELQRPADALLSLQHASKLDPQDWDAAYKNLFLLHALGRFEQALAQFDRCDELQPDHVPALQLRALSLRGLGRFEEALAANQRAFALAPDNPDTCNNLGDALQSLGRSQEALQWFDRAIALRPELIQPLKNKAYVLTQLHRFDEAIAVYQRILAIDPANAAAECDLAQLQLLTGNFEAGWIAREARWETAVDQLPEIHPADLARQGSRRRQDHPRLCGRRHGRFNSVGALYPDAGGARRQRHPRGRGARRCLAVASIRRLAMHRQADRGAAGLRHALPDVQPAAGLRNAARQYSLGDVLPASPAGRPRAGLGRSARPSRQAAGRPVLVRQPQPRQRPQPVAAAAPPDGHPRRRCDVHQPAKGSAA